jgi:hypothetical protein
VRTPEEEDDLLLGRRFMPPREPTPRFAPQDLPNDERFRVANVYAASKRRGGGNVMDEWFNPLDQVQRVTLYRDDNEPLVLEFAPREKRLLDRYWTQSIHQRVESAGTVAWGGQAPLLQRSGQTGPLHPALTVEAMERDLRDEANNRDANGNIKSKKGDFDV